MGSTDLNKPNPSSDAPLFHAQPDIPHWSGKPLQLLRSRYDGQRCIYEICSESAEVLRKIGRRSIAVASSLGAIHSGKSFLLNWIMKNFQQSTSQFQVGQSTQACTEGLWVCSLANRRSNDCEPSVCVFIDCEGSGGIASSSARDAHLAMICILLSSSVLLNTKGVLSEKWLTTLALACRC